MTIRQQAIALLRGATVARVNFKFLVAGTPIIVDSHAFHLVAHKIAVNGIRIEVNANPAPGVAAEYFGGEDRLVTPPLTGRFAQGTFVHESLHAYFDKMSRGIPALDDEAACYTSEVLYERMVGLAARHRRSPSRDAANPIVTGILQAWMRGVRCPEVDFTQWLALRDVIRIQPIYVNGPAGTGGSYVQNG